MSFFENENVKKGWTSKKRFLYISIGIIVIAILSYLWGITIVKDKSKETIDLETVITSKSLSNKVNKKVKLKIYNEPYLLAEKDDTSAAFYIVSNEKYFYIAKMNKSKAMSLTKTVTENGYELVGYTSSIPSEVKGFAIDEYNKAYEDKLEKKLTLADFENYFGDVCIDLSKDDSALAPIQYVVFYVGLMIGVMLVIVAIIMMIAYKVKIKKINNEDLEKLSKEINSGEAIFYEKGQIYLTKNYLIDVNNLQFFKYEDIAWVYKHIQRVNGIVSYKCLMVSTNDGKQTMMALNAKDNYEKIMEFLVTKNNDIMIGYSKENIAAFKEKKKEIKAEKKKNKALK